MIGVTVWEGGRSRGTADLRTGRGLPVADGLFLAPQSFEDFGGGDDLAHMALGMVGDVDQRSPDGGGQLLAANAAKDVEVGSGEGTDTVGGIGKRRASACCREAWRAIRLSRR